MHRSTNGGFTLLETLMALAILTTIAFFFPVIMKSFQPSNDDHLRIKEVELFFIQIGREIRSAMGATTNQRELYVMLKNGDVAKYERYGTSIRRRLNETGHEIMLQNIQHVIFNVDNNVVTIQITGRKGEQYERKIAIMVKRDEK